MFSLTITIYHTKVKNNNLTNLCLGTVLKSEKINLLNLKVLATVKKLTNNTTKGFRSTNLRNFIIRRR